MNLNLTWCKNCLITDMTTQNVFPVEGDDPAIPAIDASRNASLAVKKRKTLCTRFCSFSLGDNIKIF